VNRCKSASAPRQQRRRVAFVLAQNSVGGTELQARWLVQALRSAGVSVDVFLLDGSTGCQGLANGRVVCLAGHRMGGPLGIVQFVRMAAVLHIHLRRGDYAVVHGAMARGYLLSAVAAYGVKSTRTVAWRRNVGVHLTNRHPFIRCLDRLSARITDRIIANSPAVRDYWVAHAGGERVQFQVVPNAVEGWRFERVSPAMLTSAVPCLVSVGGLKPAKGHSLLIEACALLAKRGIETQLVLLGIGSEADHLRVLAADLGVALHLPGQVEDPRPWLERATVYVHPSLSEGMSNAIAEAMAYGMPIVATDVGGTVDMLGGAGLSVPSGSAPSLSDAVESLLTGTKLAQHLSTLASSRARLLFHEDLVLKQYLEAFEMADTCAAS
jgi:glycosyltransferase involved in cell wall biosynthesis